MMFVPYDQFSITTDLPLPEVRRILSECRKAQPAAGILPQTAEMYEGFVNKNHFELSRVIRYRDSMLPTIIGDIYPDDDGSMIAIRLRPAMLTVAVLILGCAIPAFFSLSMIAAIFNEGTFNGTALYPLLMLLGFYTLMTAWFKVEAGIERRNITELFTKTGTDNE
jgi:hypothetical protein